MRSLIKNIVRPFYKKLQYTPIIQAVEEEFEIQSYLGVTSRYYEYPFGIKQVISISKKKKIESILEAGATGSVFGPILASFGFKVVGVDILPWDIKFPNFKQVLGDLKKLPFEDNSFDVVTSISTTEHCGLPRFGEELDKDGDVKCVKEFYRVIKPKGHLILTVPYAGRGGIYQNKHRVYDPKSFKRLMSKFKVIHQEFFAPVASQIDFQSSTKEKIEKMKSVNGSHGVICIVAIKNV